MNSSSRPTFYPEGVEFKLKRLSEVADYVRGITYNKNQELKDPKESLNGLKVLRANNIDVDFNRLNFDEVKLLINSIPVKPAQYLSKNDIFICAGSGSREHIGKVAFIDENLDYIFGGFMAVVRVFSGDINPRFLFHTLCGQFFRDYIAREIDSTTINNLSSSIVRNFLIPIPPLETQKRIVEILDKFTELTTELTTELKLRKKQYTYYLNQLLDFGTPENPREGVEFKSLGEIAEFRRGSFPQPYTNKAWYGGEGAMPFVQVADVGSMRLAENTKQTISKVAQKSSVFVPKGTTIVTLQGTIGRVAVTQYDSFVDRTILIFETYKIEINKKYFAYAIAKKFEVEAELARGSTLKTITKEELKDFQIPIPPLETQKRIVEILDKFESLTTDLTQGVPAEIQKRQKQYEYYRDWLLSFREEKTA